MATYLGKDKEKAQVQVEMVRPPSHHQRLRNRSQRSNRVPSSLSILSSQYHNRCIMAPTSTLLSSSSSHHDSRSRSRSRSSSNHRRKSSRSSRMPKLLVKALRRHRKPLPSSSVEYSSSSGIHHDDLDQLIEKQQAGNYNEETVKKEKVVLGRWEEKRKSFSCIVSRVFNGNTKTKTNTRRRFSSSSSILSQEINYTIATPAPAPAGRASRSDRIQSDPTCNDSLKNVMQREQQLPLNISGGRNANVQKRISDYQYQHCNSSSYSSASASSSSSSSSSSYYELCKKKILMGAKCRPLHISGTLCYDKNGVLVPEPI